MKNRNFVALLAVVLLCGAGAVAQDVFGTITGAVMDSTGAAIPGAKVTVINTDKGIVVREVESGATGLYTVPKLLVGHYSVTVEAKGFKKVTISSIDLNVGEIYRSDVTMQVGSVVETVTVEAAAIQVETESAIAGSLITGAQVRELSLNNRNYEQLVSLSPGVSYGGTDQLYVGTTNPSGQTNVLSFSINGQRTSANNWTVDGADNVDRGSNLTLLNYPSVEAIAEFKVLRNIYSAEFGRAASGNVNVITRSGGSDWHGNAYEFVRNDIFNANNYVNNATGRDRAPLRYNNFGWTLSGPVIIPGLYGTKKEDRKTFFFFSQEFRRQNVPASRTASVPTAAEKQGIFTKNVCLSPTTLASNSCGANPVGTTVAVINPIAQEYINAIWNNIPPPTNPETHQLFLTFQSQFRTRQELARVDHVFGPRWSVFVRFLNDTIPTKEPGGLFTGAVLPGVSNTATNSPGRSWVVKSVNVFTPSFVMEAGYAYSYGAIVSRLAGRISSSQSTITTPLPFAVTLGRIPATSFTNGPSTVTGFGPYDDFNRNHNVFANLSKQFSRHTLKFGFSYNHYQKTENAAGNNAGSFNFNAFGAQTTGLTTTPTCNASCQTADANFQQTWANFLLGNANLFTQASLDLTPDIQTNQLEWYVQDSWKVHPNLTLDFGLRHSLFRQPHDNNKLLTTFDPASYDPALAPVVSATTGLITSATGTFDPLNGIIIAGAAGAKYGTKVAKEDNLNFAPRLGFAWDPFGKGKTAIRGGYGLAYDSGLVGILEQNIFINPPFTQSVSISTTRFENPTAASPTLSASPIPLRATSPDMKIPYAQSWSLDVQQEVPGRMILALGYYGNKGTHLIGIADINQPTPGQLLIRNGVPVVCTAGQLNTPCQTTGTASPHINAVRPYLGYGPINSILSIFTSNYNSMQFSLQKRFSGNSSLNFSYTWSHGLTTAQTDRSSSPQNHYNIRAEYGASQLDRRQILTANWVYELPWRKDQSGVLGHLLGGWQTSGIFYAYTGLPLTVTASGSDSGGQGYNISTSSAGGRPDRIGDPSTSPHGTSFQSNIGVPWLDTSVFAPVCPTSGQAPTAFCANSRAGTSGRGVAYGPGFWKIDFSLFKNILITERFRFQFRWETFNVFNHTNPFGVNTNLTSGTFGRITSYRDPREMQFGFKLSF
ncbi:MAG: carboxypeptidase regulatory-like domain-containing protein [Acidobacteria bacterium]|nr:carboxypeptidase regulatory-like domain-containing protein [Acidobacteriota bacterium]MCL5288796.1 carboxypeptidase regulatory-like domain-containing protein [Acidobacteriota bacterium]